MVSHLFFYQLALIALAWLFFLLLYAWPSDRARVKSKDAALHLQEPLDKSLGDIGLAPALLAENGNVGVKRGVRNGMGFKLGHDEAFNIDRRLFISILIVCQIWCGQFRPTVCPSFDPCCIT
jgi:hypothetical protein